MSWKVLLRGLLLIAVARCSGSQEMNIAFDLPDLSAIIESEYGEFQLEAYKAAHNDRILQSDGERLLSQLYWVSLGEPKLVRTTDRRKASKDIIFDLKFDRVSVQVSTLTAVHRRELAATAYEKHRVNISERQVVNMPLSHVDCHVNMLDDDGRSFLLTGSAGNLQTFPIRVDFMAPRNSPERQMLERLLKNHTDELSVECKFAAKGKKVRTNTLEITSKQIKHLGLVEKLFGPVDQVFVTRQQLVELSSELYSALSIVEEYEMPEFQFSEAFISGLLQQTVLSTFSDVDVDEALATLSRYATGFEQDLSADRIKNDLGSLMKVNSEGSRRHIVYDNDAFASLSTSAGRSSAGSAGASYLGIAIGASGSSSKTASQNSSSRHKSLDDQLSELNSHQESDVRWAIEGDRVVPRSIRVAKMWRGSFRRTLRFTRVLREVTEAAFSRTFRMEIANVDQGATAWERLTLQLQQQQENMNTLLSQAAELTAQLRNTTEEVQLLKNGSSMQHMTKPATTERTAANISASSTPRTDDPAVLAELERWKKRFDESGAQSSRWTLLHFLSQKGVTSLVTWLLDGGDSVDVEDQYDQSPLYLASANGHVDVVKVLLDHNAAINRKRYDEWTPLHTASYNGHLEVVRMLLQRGADVNSRNADGKTPLKRARERGFSSISALLEEWGGVA